MKKQTALALAAVFAMSVAGTALAAPNAFADVPAKHWAYDSVSKLAKAGVISGYGDNTFQGDKTLTRYEIAVIVAKAMNNTDKMNPETKATLDKLEAEFASELNNLGVRVDKLEKNASKVKFTGEIRERYEYSDGDVNGDKINTNDKTDIKTRVRISMTAPIAENVTFKGRLHTESEFGNSANDSSVVLDQAYITGKLGDVTYNAGRQPILLGQKLLVNNSQYNDGLVLTAGNDVKVTVGAYKYAKTPQSASTVKNDNGVVTAVPATVGESGNYTIGNIAFKLSNTLNVSASYLADDNDDNKLNKYDSIAAGLKYTGLKNFTVTGEYGENRSDFAKALQSGDNAKAWASRVAYLGANPAKVHSFGVYVSYRKAETGFDDYNWNDFSDLATWNGSKGALKEMDNIKGLDYGFEYTLFKNGVMRLQYNDMEDYKGQVDKKNLFAELIYTF